MHKPYVPSKCVWLTILVHLSRYAVPFVLVPKFLKKFLLSSSG